MLDTMTVVGQVKSFGFDEHVFPVEQAGDASLTRFGTFVLTIGAGGRVVCRVLGRLLICGDIAFVVPQNDLVI